MSPTSRKALDVEDILSKLSLDEKIALLSGKPRPGSRGLAMLTPDCRQVLTSGTRSRFPASASPLSAFPMGQMEYGARASSTALRPLAFLA